MVDTAGLAAAMGSAVPAVIEGPGRFASVDGTAEPAPPPDADAGPTFHRPEHVRGIYLTAWSAGSSWRLERLIELARRTEINNSEHPKRSGVG